MTDGGDGNVGIVYTDEMRKRIGEASKGRPGYWKGKKIPPEVIEKVRKAITGKPNYKARGKKISKEHRLAVSNANKGNKYGVGKKFTEERKRNISLAKGYKWRYK